MVDILRHSRQLLADSVNPAAAVGMFLHYMPIVLQDRSADSLQQLDSIARQLRKYWDVGWAFETVQFLTNNESARAALKSFPTARILFNYEGRVAQYRDDGLFRVSDADHGNTHSPRGRRDHALVVRASLDKHVLNVRFIYSSKIHRRETVQNLANKYRTQLFNLLDLCGE